MMSRNAGVEHICTEYHFRFHNGVIVGQFMLGKTDHFAKIIIFYFLRGHTDSKCVVITDKREFARIREVFELEKFGLEKLHCINRYLYII